MSKRKIVFFVLLSSMLLLFVGCENPVDKITDQLSDEDQIVNQINKWAKAWETKDTSYFRDTMTSDNITFSYYDENFKLIVKESITIDKFIELVTNTDDWKIWNEEIDNSKVEEIEITLYTNDYLDTAVLKGVWNINVPIKGVKYKSYIMAGFAKLNGKWVITFIEQLGRWEEYE